MGPSTEAVELSSTDALAAATAAFGDVYPVLVGMTALEPDAALAERHAGRANPGFESLGSVVDGHVDGRAWVWMVILSTADGVATVGVLVDSDGASVELDEAKEAASEFGMEGGISSAVASTDALQRLMAEGALGTCSLGDVGLGWILQGAAGEPTWNIVIFQEGVEEGHVQVTPTGLNILPGTYCQETPAAVATTAVVNLTPLSPNFTFTLDIESPGHPHVTHMREIFNDGVTPAGVTLVILDPDGNEASREEKTCNIHCLRRERIQNPVPGTWTATVSLDSFESVEYHFSWCAEGIRAGEAVDVCARTDFEDETSGS